MDSTRSNEKEIAAIIGASAYIQIGASASAYNLEVWDATGDVDDYADDVLRALHISPSGLAWRHTGGDDFGDGLTSYDYIAEVDDDELRAYVAWIGDDPERATLNMGLITGPEEYGYVPAGITFDADGMDWNMGGITKIAGASFSIWPISDTAARLCFGADLERLGN